MKGFQPEQRWTHSQTTFWVAAYGIIVLFGLFSILVVVPTVLAQGPTATPAGGDHDAHHPTGAATTVSTPATTPTVIATAGASMITPGAGSAPMHAIGDMMGSIATPTPPGMAMGNSHVMCPVDGRDAPEAPKDARGGQRLGPTLIGDIKEFKLTAQKVR